MELFTKEVVFGSLRITSYGFSLVISVPFLKYTAPFTGEIKIIVRNNVAMRIMYECFFGIVILTPHYSQ